MQWVSNTDLEKHIINRDRKMAQWVKTPAADLMTCV